MGIGMLLYLFLLLVAVLAFGYAGVRALSASAETETEDRHTNRNPVDEGPVERLKRRYTEGELSEDEFEAALDRELSGEAGETENHAGTNSAPKEHSEPAYDR